MNPGTARPDPTVERFVFELVRCGLSFSDLMASLIESLEDRDPWPGEEPGEVVLQMAAGSVQAEFRSGSISPDDIEKAIDLIVHARERLVKDLRLAAELAGRRQSMRR